MADDSLLADDKNMEVFSVLDNFLTISLIKVRFFSTDSVLKLSLKLDTP
jgi:hypothetical protein